MQSVTLIVPMSGDVELLKLRAKRSRVDLAHARVYADRVEVDITERMITQQALDAVLASVVEHVEWFNNDLPGYNEPMRQGVREALAAARSRNDDVLRVSASLTTPLQVAEPAVVAAPAPAPQTAKGSRQLGRIRQWWGRHDTGTRIAFASLAVAILAMLCGMFAPLSFLNDVFPFREMWNGDTSVQSSGQAGGPQPGASTKPVQDCPSIGAPVLQVFPSATPQMLVFQGEGFPKESTIQVDLRLPAASPSTIIAAVGSRIADSCGKFTVVWPVPDTLDTTAPLTAAAIVAGRAADSECCAASVEIDVAELIRRPLKVESVQPKAGESPGSPNVIVRVTGSRAPVAGRIYWLCAVNGGKFYPKQSVSSNDAVTTSLGGQPMSWQILVVEAGPDGSAAMQDALARDGFTEGLPADTRIVSDQVAYQVSQP